MRKEKHDIIRLIVKGLKGKLTPGEAARLHEWRSCSTRNEETYRRLEHEYREHAEYPLFRQLNSRKDWSKVVKGVRARRYARRWARVTVAACLLTVVGVSCLLFDPRREVELRLAEVVPDSYSFRKKACLILADGDTLPIESVVMDTIGERLPFVSNSGEALIYHDARQSDTLVYNILEIPRGGAYSLQLADGTRVMLNSDSRLRFPLAFTGGAREVYLEGEGYFQVAKDTVKPFVVHCAGHRVRVLGTAFNVSAYRDDEVSTTTLVEGKVNIEQGGQTVSLVPGQMASVRGGEITKREVNVDSYISWTRDQFSFNEERLEDLLKRISRWYDVSFEFEDPGVKDCKFSGFIPRYESITNLFEILEQSASIRFVDKGDKRIMIIKN